MTFIMNMPDEKGGKKAHVYRDILPAEIPDDLAFIDILKEIASYTMTANNGADTIFGLFQAIKYICQNHILGSIVECGVWRGGSMMLMARALQHFGDTSRELYLYDTFAGMTEPEDKDIDYDGMVMRPIWQKANLEGKVIGFGGSPDDVRANLRQTGYPEEKTHLIAGDILNTIPAQLPPAIAVLRLDTDWYKSTLHELKHLYQLIVPHGILIIDDYGWCRGARQATDEFFSEQPFKPMMHRLNEAVRVIVKPNV